MSVLSSKLEESKTRIEEARQALFNETKSSAGDKHETGREMARQELEKVELNHSNLNKSWVQLNNLNPIQTHSTAEPGSLVVADHIYFISVGLGPIHVEGHEVFCLSPSAPLSVALNGLKSGDQTDFRNQRITVQAIA